MDEVSVVAAEVYRILASPYAASLRVDALASAVLEGLRYRPYSLDVVRILSNAVSIRDAFLRFNPSILPWLLEKADVAAGDAATEASVSILSSPLPFDYAVPAVLAAFVLQLSERAVGSSSAETLRPLHAVLKGMKADIMEFLPPKELRDLQDQLIELLRNFDDHAVNLLSLAILATLCSNLVFYHAGDNVASSQECQSNVEVVGNQQRGVCESARKFFNAKRARKTLDLVVLRASWSCSGNLGPSDAISSLGLIEDILDAIENEEKVDWVQQNMGKVKKLHEKVRRSDIDRSIRNAALGVVLSLSDVKTLPQDLIAVVESLLERGGPGHNEEKVLTAYAGHFSEAFILRQILRAFQAATKSGLSGLEALIEIKGLRTMMRCLLAAAKISSAVRQKLLVALSLNDLQESLYQFLSSAPPKAQTTTRHESHETCAWNIGEAKRYLVCDICVLLLTSAFGVSAGEVAIDICLAAALLDKAIKQSFSAMPYCSFKIAAFHQPRTNMDNDDDQVAGISRNWGALLKRDLDLKSAHCHELVVRRVAALCDDLQIRCDNAERPLIEEQKRAQNLDIQLTDCKLLCAELESKTQERSLVVNALKNREVSLIDEKTTAENKAQELFEELKSVRLQLSLANEQAVHAAKAAREAARQQELSYLATMTAKDEILDSEAQKIISMEVRQARLDENLQNARKELDATIVEFAGVLDSLEKRAIRTAELENDVKSRDIDLEQRLNIELQHANLIEKLECELNHLRSENEIIKVEERGKVNSLNQMVSELREKHLHEIIGKETEILRQKTEHEVAITAIQKDLEMARNESARLTAIHQEQHATLSEALTKLTGRSSGRLAIMNPANSTTCSDDNRCIEETEHVDQDHIRATSQRSFESDSSNNRDSVTKRARLRRNLKTPFIHDTECGAVGKASKVPNSIYRKSKRHPLQDIEFGSSCNGAVTPYKHITNCCKNNFSRAIAGSNADLKEPGLSQNLQDLSFGESNIYSSTDYHGAENEENEAILGLYE
ncbi:hypothetical protein MMC13_002099 [Lambiella insularis]|nr:hypothetical protein [Lambiella insularis]